MVRAQQAPLVWTRWLRAGAIAGLWACGTFVAMLVVLTFLVEGESWQSFARELAWAGPLYLAISLPLALLLSLIGHVFLRALGLRHPTAFVLGGAVLGAIAGVVITLGKEPGVLIIGCGLAGAAAGWGYHRSYQGPAAKPRAQPTS